MKGQFPVSSCSRVWEKWRYSPLVPCCCVYVISSDRASKIGVAKDVPQRVADLQIGNDRELRVSFLVEVNSRQIARRVESESHRMFCEKHLRGEWFAITPQEAGDGVWEILHKGYIPHTLYVRPRPVRAMMAGRVIAFGRAG